ncbi:hypothetical protein GCM10010885_21670 [Alicyclobacillus cellulosilyticus]|uniref:Uncharacterized protein n=2 Tax=Alicyclobacillus cellulosilyticus TaxID=1003997 RepID=A0A917KF68_9BACL|nr:hypothetical protein GCM10010885_21670 [Alicyclobacillus cellulosilyticus]
MRMEAVQEQLQQWGELIITTAAGESYEIHLGDTTFDVAKRVIKLSTPDAEYLIDGDAVENVKKHYGHKVDADDTHH